MKTSYTFKLLCSLVFFSSTIIAQADEFRQITSAHLHKQVNNQTVWADVLYDGDPESYIPWEASDLPNPNDQDWAILDLFSQNNIVKEIHIFARYLGSLHNSRFKIYVERTSGFIGSTLVYDKSSGNPLLDRTWTIIPVSSVDGNRIVIKGYDGKPMALGEVKVYGHSPFVNASVKVFLEGTYNSHAMNNNLGTSIPLSQPYNTEPWDYTGSETTSQSFITNNNIVDWVLVQLRLGSTPDVATYVSGTRAALLRDDGVILDTDGSTDILFNYVSIGSYYITVIHRNHLSVMSPQKISLGE